MKKITLAVLFGGSSTEYEISLQSAHAVLTHLDRDRYEPVLLGITRDGRWLLYQGPVDALLDDTWHTDARHTVPAVISPDRGVHGLLLIAPAGPSTRYLDAAFPVLHGKNGEDGTVQGLLELAGIPVVGCGVLASALCMDKDAAHRLVRAAGVAVPPSALFRTGEGLDTLPERTASLTYPLFVKPARAGSSFGITKVEEPGVLAEAVTAALAHDSKVVIEEAVPGFEVGCAVLGFGISVEVAPRVLMVPGEGIVQAIAVVTGRQFGNVKTAFDATLVSTALLLSLLFFHRLQGLGIGTIFSALAVGRFVDLYNRRLPLISRISALGART